MIDDVMKWCKKRCHVVVITIAQSRFRDFMCTIRKFYALIRCIDDIGDVLIDYVYAPTILRYVTVSTLMNLRGIRCFYNLDLSKSCTKYCVNKIKFNAYLISPQV